MCVWVYNILFFATVLADVWFELELQRKRKGKRNKLT